MFGLIYKAFLLHDLFDEFDCGPSQCEPCGDYAVAPLFKSSCTVAPPYTIAPTNTLSLELQALHQIFLWRISGHFPHFRNAIVIIFSLLFPGNRREVIDGIDTEPTGTALTETDTVRTQR